MTGGELTLGRWIRDRARTSPDRVAIDVADTTVTYTELDARSEQLAAGLLARGLVAGDRVATLTRNSAEHVEAFWACTKAGLVLTPLSWRLAPTELAYQLTDAEPALLLAEPGLEGLATDAATVAQVGVTPHPLTRGGLDDLAAAGAGAGHAHDAVVTDEQALLLVYTSGTTGRPRGAVLTHRNCFWTNLSFDRIAEVCADDVVLQVLPQFHVGGWNVQPLLAWWKGATVVLEPEFDPGRCLDLIGRKGITTMMGVPATYLFMAEHGAFAEADLASLRQAVVGGAPMPVGLLRTWEDRGVPVTQGYGLTEAAPNVLCLPPEEASRRIGCAGKPYPHVDVALRDTRTGQRVDGPGRGELLVRGPNVFAGYWRDPDATSGVVDGAGWLATGDVAERDEDGFYRIRDRAKDLIISGGENVEPAEIESVLHDHPDVVEAAVVGVPDPRWGEVGLACVVLRHGADTDADGLLAFCRERLASYKVPKHVRFVDALPRSGMNKVVKPELRARYTAEVTG